MSTKASSANGNGATPPAAADLWQNLLRDTAAKAKMQDSNLFVLGDRCSGKNSLLTRMRFRTAEQSSESVGGTTPSGTSGAGAGADAPSHQFPEAMAFTYFPLFDPDEPDSDSLGLPTKVNVWTVGETACAADLLPTAVGTAGLDQTAVVIIVNLSTPHAVMADLHKWLEVVEATFKQPVADLPLPQQAALREKIQALFDAKGPAAAAAAAESPTNADIAAAADGAETKEDGAAAADAGDDGAVAADGGDGGGDGDGAASAVGKVKVERNLGVPVIVVGTHSDYLLDGRVANPLTPDQCDFLQMHLRRVCLQYGAALCYTSAVRGAANCAVLQKYVLHRLYPSQYTFAPKPEIIERDAIFVPAGWDSPRRIDDVVEDGSGVSASAAFNDVIKFPPGTTAASAAAAGAAAGAGAGAEAAPAEPSFRAPEYQEFLSSLGELAPVTTGATPGKGGADGGSGRDKQHKQKLAFLVNQAKGKSSTPTGGAAALLARRASGAGSPRVGGAGGDSPGGAGGAGGAGGEAGSPGEPDHLLLKNFFRGLMNRSGTGGAAGAAAAPGAGAKKAKGAKGAKPAAAGSGAGR